MIGSSEKAISVKFLCFLYYSVPIQYRFPNSFGAMTMNEKLTNDSNHTLILEYTPFWVISLLALQSRP